MKVKVLNVFIWNVKVLKVFTWKVNRDYGGTEDFFVDIAVELVLERRSLLDRKVFFQIASMLSSIEGSSYE